MDKVVITLSDKESGFQLLNTHQAAQRHVGASKEISRTLLRRELFTKFKRIAEADQKWNEAHYRYGLLDFYSEKIPSTQKPSEAYKLTISSSLVAMSFWWGVSIHQDVAGKLEEGFSFLSDTDYLEALNTLNSRFAAQGKFESEDSLLIADLVLQSLPGGPVHTKEWLGLLEGVAILG